MTVMTTEAEGNTDMNAARVGAGLRLQCFPQRDGDGDDSPLGTV